MAKKALVIAEIVAGVVILAGGGVALMNGEVRQGVVDTVSSMGVGGVKANSSYEKSPDDSSEEVIDYSKGVATQVDKVAKEEVNFELFFPNGSGDFYYAKSGGLTAVFNGGDKYDENYLTNTIKENKLSGSDYLVFTDTHRLSVHNAIRVMKEVNPKYVLINTPFKKAESTKKFLKYLKKEKLTYTVIVNNGKYYLGDASFSLPKLSDTANGVIFRNKHNTFVSTGVEKDVDDKFLKYLPTNVEGYFVTQGEPKFVVPQNVLDYLKPKNTLLNDKKQVDNTDSKATLKGGATNKLYNVREMGNITIQSDGVNYSIHTPRGEN